MAVQISRRGFLRISGLGGTLAALAACNPLQSNELLESIATAVPTAAPKLDPKGFILHTLRRFTFGPTETELDAALAMGLESWLEEQLAADASDAPDVESRPAENGGGGTDHGHGGVIFVMGGGILGGKVYGEWPGLAPDNLYGPGILAITTDFREVLAEIVQKRLGNDRIDEIFPGYRAGGFLGLAAPRGG